jgi:hypothetical protein
MGRGRQQEKPSLMHWAFSPGSLNDQAAQDKPKKWFWKGLERFVNAGDSTEDYRSLAKGWPTFWPVTIEGRDLNSRDKTLVIYDWNDEAYPLFLFYRNILRALWTRDPATSTNGTFINILFGLEIPKGQFEKCFPHFRPGVATTSFWPEWGAGVIRFVSYTDFQRAIWLLFCELWRAKMCASCSQYFIAEKPAQSHCSISCSSRAHNASSLKWWRKKGAKRRAGRATRRKR